VCKFGRNRAICVIVEEAICAKSLCQKIKLPYHLQLQFDIRPDGRTDDGRRAMVLARGMS